MFVLSAKDSGWFILKHSGSSTGSPAGSSTGSSSGRHVFSCSASFEDVEAIDEVEHEVGGKGIGGGIANIVGRDVATDVAALL